jgi:hypothetical protein
MWPWRRSILLYYILPDANGSSHPFLCEEVGSFFKIIISFLNLKGRYGFRCRSWVVYKIWLKKELLSVFESLLKNTLVINQKNRESVQIGI